MYETKRNTITVTALRHYIRAAGLKTSQHSANSFRRQLVTLALGGLVFLTNQLRTSNNQETGTCLYKWLLYANSTLGSEYTEHVQL